MTFNPFSRKLASLRRRGWWLWALTLLVMLALTATVPLLYIPQFREAAESQPELRWIGDGYTAMVGLIGLVVLFSLYIMLKQRELHRVRDAYEHEARELADVRTRLSELSALFQVSTTLNLQLRLGVILEVIVRRVVATLKAQQASVMIYNSESGLLETRASYGLESEFARDATKKMGEGIAGWVAEHREPVLLGPQAPNLQFGQHYKSGRQISSALSLPLKVGERCVGVLNVNRINHPEQFNEHHRDILRMFAEHVGAVIDRAETLERIGSRARQLEADNQKLSELNRLKDVFLSTASHELKTPLTSVIGYAEILDENQERMPAEQARDFIRRLRGEAERLMGLIEDILDLSRLESGKLVLHPAPLPINVVAHEAVETSLAMAEKHRVQLAEDYGEDMPLLSLDDVKMRQVLVNLIGNAVKFSPEGGQVTVRTVHEPQVVRVEVCDSGPGIQPEESSRIFELFGQGTRRKGGLGIGLHLVKRITEMHGGCVGVNSVAGHGSTFWVCLPLQGEQPATEPAASEQAA